MTAPAAPVAVRILALWSIVLAALVLLVPHQLLDPFLRSDDYPALRAEAALYEWKTLAKGRWVNWLWMLRPWPTGAQTLFALHLAAWALTAAAAGAGFFRADASPWRALLLALAIALMPQGADMAAWPATLMVPTLLVALFAAVAALARFGVMLGALALLVPLALMGHSTAALTMLALALLAADWRGPGARIWSLLAVFVLALGAGMAAMAGLNGLVHGHYGLRLEDWLETHPATDLASAADNAAAALVWFWRMMRYMALGQAPLALALGAASALGLVLLWRARPAEAWRWLLVAGLLTGLMAAPMLLRGIDTPPRASGPLWLLLLALMAGLARASVGGAARLLGPGAMAFMALCGGVIWFALHERSFAPYQALTRALAAPVVAAAQTPGVLLVRGQVHALPDTAALQFGLGFAMRMEELTGLPTHLCEDQASDLARGSPPRDEPWTRADMAGWERRRQDGQAACAAHGQALTGLPRWPAPGFAAPLAAGAWGMALPERPQEKSEAIPSLSQSP